MPSSIFPGECAYDVWDDRSHAAFWNNTKLIKSDMTADAFFAGADDKSFLAWATAVVSEVEGRITPLTGATLIRYTDVASGFPRFRLTGIVATKNLKTREYGITLPEQREAIIDMEGRMMVGWE